jgi:HSP20 family molecular chaperone IbpA
VDASYEDGIFHITMKKVKKATMKIN